MTPEQREELREKAKSATPGPWFENGRIVCHEVSTRWPPVARTDMTHGMGEAGEEDSANAAFISAANPVAVTDLLDDHKRMSARIAELESRATGEAMPTDKVLLPDNSFIPPRPLRSPKERLADYYLRCLEVRELQLVRFQGEIRSLRRAAEVKEFLS